MSNRNAEQHGFGAEAHAGLDALLPQEMAEQAERVGVAKTRLDIASLLALAVLAGALIALGAGFALVVVAGADGMMPYGVSRLLAGVAFSLGLILVIVGGAELFTGNNLMIMACASGRVGVRELMRAWALVYVGNFVGAAGMALLVFLAATHTLGEGAVGAAALALAEGKGALSGPQALARGVLANLLVCLAVWLCFSARTVTDKIMAIVFPIAGFVAAGFEHSIANMFGLPLALLIKFGAADGFWLSIGRAPEAYPHITVAAAALNLAWVTLGNMLGGVAVGITYWFVYLRRRAIARAVP